MKMEQEILKLLKNMKNQLRKEYNRIDDGLDDYDRGVVIGKYIGYI